MGILRRIWQFDRDCREKDGRAGPIGYLMMFAILGILLVISHSITGSWGF